MLALESKVPFGIFNAGTGRETSVNEMISILNKKLGKNITPKYVENKIRNYVGRTCADTSKAEKLLGFRAKVSIEDGIGKLIIDCKS